MHKPELPDQLHAPVKLLSEASRRVDGLTGMELARKKYAGSQEWITTPLPMPTQRSYHQVCLQYKHHPGKGTPFTITIHSRRLDHPLQSDVPKLIYLTAPLPEKKKIIQILPPPPEIYHL